MRIGIFSDFSLPHIGGVETSIFHQHRALTAAGHQVFIISPPMKGADQIGDQLEGVVRLRSPVQIYFDGMGIYLYKRGVFKLLDKLQLDVVHVQSEYNVGSLGLRYARRRGLPVLYTAHTFYPPQIELFMSLPKTMALLATFAQKLTVGKLVSKKRFVAEDNFCGIPCRSFAQKRIFDVWLKFAAATDAILAPSHRMMLYMEHFIKDKPVYYLINPFNSSITDSDTIAFNVTEPMRLVTTSVLRPEKRPDVLIKAVALLSHAERAKMQLEMYGGGKMMNDLKKLIKDHGLEHTVRLHGSVDNRIIQQALMASDVVISMSVGFDNQPMVILEGLHAGNAILYCDKYLTEGTHGENAVLAGQTAEEFAASLRRLINDPEGVAEMKRNSKQLARQYSYNSYVSNYNEILRSLSSPR
jgi:1,2-diacylglycerol 3-alpha-glucosyltransferase